MIKHPPKLLYKYKSLESKKNLLHVLDIIDSGKIYLSDHDKVNDPLEGVGYNINIKGWAGMSIQYYADEELGPIEEMKNQFRILSLSENPQSPQLWAHYADNYKGICLCFTTQGSLSDACKVSYAYKKPERNPRGELQLKKAVRNGFFCKHSGWSYEEEWRIVREKTNDHFLHFEKNELVGVILGQNIDDEDKKEILKRVPTHIKIMKTKIGYQNPQVNIQPLNYVYEYNGESIYYIENMEKYLLGENVK